jgi:hypothetical protein
MVSVKAHFDGKVIVPDEPVDLPKDQPLIVQVRVARSTSKPKKQSALDWIAEHAVADDSLPVDLSYQLDHYLYGTPKKEPPKQ